MCHFSLALQRTDYSGLERKRKFSTVFENPTFKITLFINTYELLKLMRDALFIESQHIFLRLEVSFFIVLILKTTNFVTNIQLLVE